MANSNSTQSFVPVKEVRNGVVVMKDGSYRGILMCSSVNFGLKSEDEQRGIIGGFQNFLNTIDFSIQIVVHSRRMDLRPYLELLSDRIEAQRTELMKIQVREYIQFVKNFADAANIMTKTFYVVVPYAPLGAAKVSASVLSYLPGGTHETKSEGLTETFDEHHAQLEQRMALVINGIASTGIRAVALGTEEVLELLYHSFNLDEMDSPVQVTKQS